MSKQGPFVATHADKETNQSQSAAGCLVRLSWMLGGFCALVVLWVTILRGPAWTFTVRDFLYWTVVLGMIAARHIDVIHFQGRTSIGEPATPRDVRLYSAGLLGAAGTLWCLAHAFEV